MAGDLVAKWRKAVEQEGGAGGDKRPRLLFDVKQCCQSCFVVVWTPVLGTQADQMRLEKGVDLEQASHNNVLAELQCFPLPKRERTAVRKALQGCQRTCNLLRSTSAKAVQAHAMKKK